MPHEIEIQEEVQVPVLLEMTELMVKSMQVKNIVKGTRETETTREIEVKVKRKEKEEKKDLHEPGIDLST